MQYQKWISIQEAESGLLIRIQVSAYTLIPNPALEYMAILSTPSEVETPAVGMFDGLWWKRKGDPGTSGIPEAPIDGLIYGRKDGGWVEVVSGGGSFPATITSETINADDGVTHTHELTGIDISSLSVAGGYGALYNWWTPTDARKITSSDVYTVGSNTDYETLLDYLGAMGSYNTNLVGSKLKETGTIHWDKPNIDSTNIVFFNGVGNGVRYTSQGCVFSAIKQDGTIWRSDEVIVETESYGGGITLYLDDYSAQMNSGFKTDAYAVRILRAATTEELLLPDGLISATYTGNDGKVYRTICIGTQEWLADNLIETKYRNGDIIPNVTDNTAWAALTTGARCSYNNDDSNL